MIKATVLTLLFCSAVLSQTINIATWGDSLTRGDQNNIAYPTQLSQMLVLNGGVSGQSSTQIADRMLAAPDKFSWITVMWVGINNVLNPGGPATVKADIARMVAALTGERRYLVMGLLTGSDSPQGSGPWQTITALNSQLAQLYPNNYLDIRGYLISQYNPQIPQDLIDHANDVVPTSLRADGLHLNTAGYALVAQRVMSWLNGQHDPPPPPPPGGDSATYLSTDTTTKGSWHGVYGLDGASVANDALSWPSYATVSLSGNDSWTWVSNPSEVQATRRIGTGRIASCWFSPYNFTIDIQFNDTATHQVAVYSLDWDNSMGGRSQRFELLDSSDNVLDTRDLQSFQNGTYLVWNLSGHIKIRVTNIGDHYNNAAVSGVFFR